MNIVENIDGLTLIPNNSLVHADCLDAMKLIPDKSIDMILCDLPYKMTALKWDQIIPFEPLWEHYWRIIKPNRAIVLTASQPFTSKLVMSQLKYFKHEYVWVKNTSSGMMLAGKAPMKRHESVLVFSNGTAKFNEIKVLGSLTSQHHSKKKDYRYSSTDSKLYGVDGGVPLKWSEWVAPHSVLPCDGVGNRDKEKINPTQKPVALFEYLLKVYSDEGDLVLDNSSGSGTTALAADAMKRNWICIEKDDEQFIGSKNRLERFIK